MSTKHETKAELPGDPAAVSSDLLAAARALCERLRVIAEDPLYKFVWFSAWNHGINYENGPKYDKELEALESALKAANHRAERQPPTMTTADKMI